MTVRSIGGEIELDPQIADELLRSEEVVVHYWNHNPNISLGWFIKTIDVRFERTTPLESLQGKIALYSSEKTGSKHERITRIELKEFVSGNDLCEMCRGKGVTRFGYGEGYYDILCECGKGGCWKKKYGRLEFFPD